MHLIRNGGKHNWNGGARERERDRACLGVGRWEGETLVEGESALGECIVQIIISIVIHSMQ